MKKILWLFLMVITIVLFGCNTPDEETLSTENVEKWIIENYDNLEISSDIVFPKDNGEGATLVWEIEENNYLNSEGKFTQPKEDTKVIAKVNISLIVGEKTANGEVSVNLLLKGWSYELNAIYEELDKAMSVITEVSENIELPSSKDNIKLSWTSSNTKAITNEGKVIRGENDTEVTMTCKIAYKGETTTREYKVIVKKAEHTFNEVEDWLIEKYDGITVDKDIELPATLEEFGAQLVWEIGESDYLDENGKFTAPIIDTESDVFVTVYMNGTKKEVDLLINLKGWGSKIDVIEEWVKEQIKSEYTISVRFPATHPRFLSKITWSSSNEDVLSSDGIVNKADNEDITVKLSCEIEFEGEKRTLSFDILIPQKNDAEKNYEVRDWLDEKFKNIEEVTADIVLPTTYEKYGAIIEWQTNSPGVISESGKFNKPLFDRTVQLVAKTTVGKNTIMLTYEFKTYGEQPKDVWETVDMLFSYIALERITNQKYYTFGYQADYAKNEVINLGYLPFYVSDNANPLVEILEVTHGKNRTGIKKTSTEYVVVHDTGSAAPSATARAHANWLQNMTKDEASASWVSWHFTVDENEIIQHLPLDEVAYHAGDGSTIYGDIYYNTDYNKWSIGGGNRNGIGIETCVNYGSDYNRTMRRTAKLVAELLIDFNLGLDRVKQHNDFSGKDCPMTMRHAERWQEFMTLVEIEYFAKTRLNGVTFKWTSLSPEIMDDTGKIINHPGNETVVKYKVDVTYNGETKTFEFSSILNALED